MKNLLFIAALGVAGMMSANGNFVENKLDIKSNRLIELQDSKLSMPPATWVVYTSCGVAATTTADYTEAEAQAWGDRVEAANCPSLNQMINFDDGTAFNGPM